MTQFPSLNVGTWNVYLGAEFTPLFEASTPAAVTEAAADVLAKVRETRFPDRAEALAAVIARDRPDVLALQELGRWDLGDGDSFESLWDFQEVMLDALERAGAPYLMVLCSDTFTGELPVDGHQRVRFTSCDALLLRQDPEVQTSVLAIDNGHFDACLTVSVGAGAHVLPVKRGYVSVDLERLGRRLRVIVTHLDSLSGEIRMAQAHELIGVAAMSPHPVVIMGDLNSPATNEVVVGGRTAASPDGVLELLANAGYEDAWVMVHGATAGATCAERGVVVGERPLTDRLDFVFYDPDALQATDARLAGNEPADRTLSDAKLWPSDHACVLATLQFAEPAGRG
ncbi:MAG: endonuclease/exonuclease/phosphatase family protein [Nocardioidaceae bacterium]